ncbi:MAG: translocation/assembly module TamB domain-containing protein [Pasteurellaceae bacterium]|nr:translocation/assembly module TamB domain-containing protein [Pasteurellaceae bacterium]
MQDNQHSPQDYGNSAPPPAHQKRKSRWRWLAYGIVLLMVLIAIPIGFLATAKGQQFALQWLAKSMDQLSIGKVEGSLQEGLRLSDTRFVMDGVEIDAGEAALHIGFGCLLEGKACVENLALSKAKIRVDTSKLPPAQASEKATKTGQFELPLPVNLQRIAIDDLQVSVDQMDIALNHFHTGLSGQGNQLAISPTELDGLTIRLPPQAVSSEQKKAKKEKAKQTPANKLPVDWDALKQQLAQPLLTKLDPIELPLHLDLPEMRAKSIQLVQKQQDAQGKPLEAKSLLLISDVQLAAKSDSQTVELQQLSIQTDKGNVAGKGLLKLTDNYPLVWQLHANSPDLPEFKLPASQVNANLAGELFGNTTLDIQTTGAVNAQIQGSVQLAEPKTPLHFSIKSEAIRYPFVPEKGQDPLKLTELDLQLTGDLLNYALDGKVAMSGMGLPAGSVKLKGTGELTQFELEKLAINALQGRAELAGKVDWQNGVAWDAQVKLNNLNTKSLLPEWAAVLSGDLHSKGYAGRGEKGDEWGVAVSEMDMNGKLFDKQLKLKGELSADHQTLLNVPQASLIYGENTIGLQGRLGEQSDFWANIDAPNLQGLVPKLNASAKGKVRLLGNIQQPELDLDLVANNIRYDQVQLQHLTAKGKITTAEQIVGDLVLSLRQFKQGDIQIDNANLKASGSEQEHLLIVQAKGEPVGANLQISGTFDRLQQRWQGQLSQVMIQSPVGEWKADKPIAVNYDHSQVNANIAAHCWTNPKLHLCFPQAFQAGLEGNVPFEIKKLDLTIAQPFLDKNSQLSGIVTAKGDAAWFSQKAPEVSLDLRSNGIKLAQKIDYRDFPITLNPVNVKLRLADNSLNLNSDIRIENNGRLQSELWVKDLTQQRGLSGNVNLEKFNLHLINPLLNSGDKVDGEINARLTLGGNATAPQLFGNLNLNGLKVRSTAMPMDIVGGNVGLNFNGTNSTLKGNVQTKESNLLLEGDADWKKLEAWHTRISAKAQRFRIDIPGMAKVDVSPDIEVKVTPKELRLTGDIDIPWARIEVEELPESAVSVSGDEVIMEGSIKNKFTDKLPVPKNLPQQGQGMAIIGDISVNIGKRIESDVKLDAYGLKTALFGTLKVRQGQRGLGLYGQVNLQRGTFASFGQDLVIRKGLISFTGLPSQPTLDIEAIRNPEAMEDPSVVAGVKVTGIADSPDVKIFSNPSMAQDQALSYILTGRSLESGGDGSSSNSIAAALIGLSLSKSSKIVGGVGSAFGISDLNVTTAGIGDNTKVVVSGSLTPRFKVKYGVGIFAPLTELTLRYRLAPSLYLQWISSVNQAIDLLYRFEFD